MKRMLQYETEDGKIFARRLEAKKHEIDVRRRERMMTCLRRLLAGTARAAEHPGGDRLRRHLQSPQ